MRPRILGMLVAALGAVPIGAAPLAAAPSLVGTLTCTAEAAPAESKQLVGWKLSCSFEQTGTKAVQQYGGEITGLDQMTRMVGKALLVWTVMAAPAAGGAASLVGTYKTSDQAGLPPQALIGGRDQTIILQPITDGDQNVAPSVKLLQLELPKA